jgi:hypothetical protein
MSLVLNKQNVLSRTSNGLDVFKHFLGGVFVKLGNAFKNPLYDDTKASCYIFRSKSGMYHMKDFGNIDFSGDCFFFVGKLYNLDCAQRIDFAQILSIINQELSLGLDPIQQVIDELVESNPGSIQRASALPKQKEKFRITKSTGPIKTKPFSASEINYWARYGITQETLKTFDVISIESYSGISRKGKEYEIESTKNEPIFGYTGFKHTKLYRPFSKLRFLYAGEVSENYVFGFDKLPLRGDMLFFTGGEKDVLSLSARGFSAIAMNSETAQIPLKLVKGLSYRFKHLVVLFDTDQTGLESMEKQVKTFKDFHMKQLILPLPGNKDKKDISDFFALGNTSDDLKMLFVEMLDKYYSETISILRSVEIDFKNPPIPPEPIVSINDVTIGTPGNIMCVAGKEGSGKTNYLGGIISGAIKAEGSFVDTLGTFVKENTDKKAVLIYDTEQSEYQLYKNLSYILKRAERNEAPFYLKAFCLVGISRAERMNLIFESMDKFFYDYGGIHLVIIDGIADLLKGVNDEEASVALTEELFRLSAIYQTLVIGVLHTAPSGMKLRGHLGSEIQRKAAGILLIDKDENRDVSLVKALKVRDGSPFEVPVLEFAWSTADNRHVFIGQQSQENNISRKHDDLREVAIDIFKSKEVLKSSEIMDLLKEMLFIKDRMARNYIKFMREHGIIERSTQFPNQYRLNAKEDSEVSWTK